MGRKSTLSEAKVFAAVSEQMNAGGALNIQALVRHSGVSVGSLYHRFESREGLLAETWLDALQTFQAQFLAAITSQSRDSGLDAALATPRFCRLHPQRAALLACCRASEFMSSNTPPAISEQIRRCNQVVEEAVGRYATANALSLQACYLGMVAFPLGAVRTYLPSRPVPVNIDNYVAAAFKAVVEADQDLTATRQ